MPRSFAPRLNHVAMTMPPSALKASARADIEAFYGEVFGWYRYDTDESGDPLVLVTQGGSLYLYLLPGEPAMSAPALDHLGLEVATLEEVDDLLDRARAFQAHDDRVQITEKRAAPQRATIGRVTLTNAYLSYLLPLQVELQHIDVQPFDDAVPVGTEPAASSDAN